MSRTVTLLGLLALGCATDRAERPFSPDAPRVPSRPPVGGDAAPSSPAPTDRASDAPAGTRDAGVAGAASACPPAPQTFSVQTDLFYANTTDLAQALDVYVPEGAGPYPALMWIPGGGWVTGKKERLPAAVKALATRGYVVASVSHRPSTAAKFPAQIHDIKAAIRFLRANAQRFKLDPKAIGASGDSSGGHLSALAGTSGDVAALEDRGMGSGEVSSRVQAAIPFYGPSDLLKMNAHTKAAGCPAGSLDHDSPTSPESRLLGCQLQTCPEKAAPANPITYVSADDPPFLVQHGATDCVVPPGQSQVLHEALRAANIWSTLLIRPGVGHSRAPYDTDDFYGFLDRTLRRCR